MAPLPHTSTPRPQITNHEMLVMVQKYKALLEGLFPDKIWMFSDLTGAGAFLIQWEKNFEEEGKPNLHRRSCLRLLCRPKY